MQLKSSVVEIQEPEVSQLLNGEIRSFRPLLPAGTHVAACVREHTHNMYVVSFRARMKGKTMVVAARDFGIESAIHRAGSAFHRMLVERRRRSRGRRTRHFYLSEAA